MDKRNLVIHAPGIPRADDLPFEVVERKGIGHPDTLCDTLAERISQTYSQYCLEHYGVVLRHMVDKIALSGGTTKVWFGGGEIQQPIRLYLNCRFTRTFEQERIPYLEIAQEAIHAHLQTVFPPLDLDRWVTIIDNTHFAPGPGVVYEPDGTTTSNERRHFFEVPRQTFTVFHDNGVRSNDTSTAVAYAPLSRTEQAVLLIERTLNSVDFKKQHPYVGTDIKVMARRIRQDLGITVCVPFMSPHTPSAQFYAEELETLRQLIKQLVDSAHAGFDTTVSINTRDNASKSDYYLTLTGSAIESGDEGVVGRGNRSNGVIPFTRRMSMEAACGKNPVYHVGKVYTALGTLVSRDIFDALGLETYVYLTSQMGRNLSDPWSACVEVCGATVSDDERQMIEAILERNLADTNNITHKLVHGEVNLY